MGKGLLPNSCGYQQNFPSLQALTLRASVPHWLLAVGSPHFLFTTWQLASSHPARKRVPGEMSTTILGIYVQVIMCFPSPDYILLVRIESLGPRSRDRITRGHQGAGIWGTAESVYYRNPLLWQEKGISSWISFLTCHCLCPFFSQKDEEKFGLP